jgi:cobalt-zinc-cadmium efflux system membrane fusion protein
LRDLRVDPAGRDFGAFRGAGFAVARAFWLDQAASVRGMDIGVFAAFSISGPRATLGLTSPPAFRAAPNATPAKRGTSVERLFVPARGHARKLPQSGFAAMPVDSNPEIKNGDALPVRRHDGPGNHQLARGPSWPARLLVLVLVAGAVAAGGYRLLAGPFGSARSAPAVAAKAQILIRTGERIVVPEGSPVRSSLTVAPVAEQDVPRSLVLPAVVEADPARLIKVLPPLAGRVTQLKVQLGQRVEAGQPLVVIDSPDLASAYADYDRAKVLLSLALRSRDRQRALIKIGGAADKDVQQSETDYATADAELRRSDARLKQIGVDAETADKTRTVTVNAPMAGSIIDLAVAPGAFWNDATAALMTVADLGTIWVTAGVPEKDTALVAKGQAVDVSFTAYPGEVFKGQVLFVSDVLDTDTRRTRVRIAFDNPGTRLRPGMFANVTFHAPTQHVPVVPASALVLKDDATQVFVETTPWTFESRTVDVAFQQGDRVVLSGGVKAGDRVVVKGGVLLSD